MTIEVFQISGMTCDHCTKRVQKAFASHPEVTQVNVSLNPPLATVSFTHPSLKEELQTLLSKVGGYKIVGVVP